MRFLIILTFSLLSASVAGQINQRIDNYSHQVDHLYGDLTRPFVGSFDFVTLPEPLQPTRVNFTFEVLHEHVPDGDWTMKVYYQPKVMRLMSESTFVWPGPHPVGAIYSGTMEFIPLASGLHGFSVALKGQEGGRLFVTWCLDQDGQLTYLGQPNSRIDCSRTTCTFFNEDSVHIMQQVRDPHPGELFSYSITVQPPFVIGDTSTVRYRLTAVEDILNEIDIRLNALSMQLVSEPNGIPCPLHQGDEVEVVFRVVPLAVRDRQGVVLQLRLPSETISERRNQPIPCYGVFYDSGELRFIADETLNFIDTVLLPTAFRPSGPGDFETIQVFKDGTIKRSKF